MLPRLSDELLERELCYRILSLCFQQPPDGQLLAMLQNKELLQAFPVIGNPLLSEALQLLTSGLDAEPQQLAQEFHRLLSPQPSLSLPTPLPPPRESSYRDPEVLLPGPPPLAVRKIYAYFGFTAQNRLVEDHIARELQFMSHLCLLEQEDGLETCHAQRTFLMRHILPWVPRFCTDLAKASAMAYFQGLGRLTSAFVLADSDASDERFISTISLLPS